MASHPLASSPSLLSLKRLYPFLKVQLKRGIMIIKHMNGAKKKKRKREPISTLLQALAFKGSGGDSKIRRLNSLKTFDEQPLLAVIGRIKRRRAKPLCSTACTTCFHSWRRTAGTEEEEDGGCRNSCFCDMQKRGGLRRDKMVYGYE